MSDEAPLCLQMLLVKALKHFYIFVSYLKKLEANA